ncbi:MAG: arylsulfotransferase family protein [Rubrobacter sp.]
MFCAPKNGPGEAGPGQDGCLILDNTGQVVWFRPVPTEAMDVMDFKMQRYGGMDVLTWWEGEHTGYGRGEYVMVDGEYREVGRVRAADGYAGDHHEFLISPQDTALFDIYGRLPVDLSPYGGAPDGSVLEGVIQELDVESGEVLFEWHSLDHVGIDESYVASPYDYFHINSIAVADDDNLIVSARNTWTVYKIDRKSGEVIWRLGGKKSDFEVELEARTRFQHDARPQPDGTITIFDNGEFDADDRSYGIVLELDEIAMTATLVRGYPHPEGRLSGTQGSMQVLPNGNCFIGWGSGPLFSEFSREGELLFGARFPPESESYRTFRFPWSGRPQDKPAVVAEAGNDDRITLHASWNGATQVAAWQVLAGPGAEELEGLVSVARKGFETEITVHTAEPYVGVQARDASGKLLGTSEAVRTGG